MPNRHFLLWTVKRSVVIHVMMPTAACQVSGARASSPPTTRQNSSLMINQSSAIPKPTGSPCPRPTCQIHKRPTATRQPDLDCRVTDQQPRPQPLSPFSVRVQSSRLVRKPFVETTRRQWPVGRACTTPPPPVGNSSCTSNFPLWESFASASKRSHITFPRMVEGPMQRD